ncbi:DUF1542 domain-containing protein [Streptococcus pneumoniae]|uniref:YSIRK signal domain/LPXTG anchor domain surface protein n=3 Tax=Streptococcus pneumoniae TaxID=1313 RepID=UPI0005E41C7C|nr:YSIRK signal domain/LPXTG anchor domain surface protein [Streptococcus pneumoniae]CJT57357.1 gram-positive signal peptide%2C YSIRK family [Streptococcus pneumoniae]CNZ80157.1 gram-positive signal peptide%2C YSIRK family [Streptococcus pneumoniae]
MKHPFNSRQRFSIRKFSFGAASVLLGAVLLGQNPVRAEEPTQGQEPNIQLAEDRTPPLSSDSETSHYNQGNLRQEQEKKEQEKKAEEKKIPDSQEGKKVSDASSDRSVSPSSNNNNGESSEGSDRSSRSAVSGGGRSSEETSNSGQHTPARRVRRARSAGEEPNTVSRSSQSSLDGRDRAASPASNGGYRESALNGKFLYGINPYPVPDDKYDDKNYLNDNWPYAKNNWLNANTRTTIFKVHVDEFVDGLITVKRINKPTETKKTGGKRDNVFRDEIADSTLLDIFNHYPEADRMALSMEGRGEKFQLKVYSTTNQLLTTIDIPRKDLWIKQSDWNAKEGERRKVEDEARKRREAAANAIDEAATQKKADLAAAPNLTPEEREAAANAIDEAARKAKEKVANAQNNAEVERLQGEGVGEVNGVDITAHKKPEAEQAIDEAATQKKADLAAAPNLTPEEAGGLDQVDTTNTRNKRSLPNTGTASSATMLATAATSAFLGLGLVGRRRRKKNKKA